MAKRNKITTDKIVEELAAIGLAKVTDFLSVRDGVLEIKSTEEMPAGRLGAIASVERTSTGLRLKLYDKLKALELLGKYMGVFDGRDSPGESRDNKLLEAILKSTREEIDVYDIPEIQQAAAAGHDLVEPSEPMQV